MRDACGVARLSDEGEGTSSHAGVALAGLVREAQPTAAVAEQKLAGEESMSYLLLLVLGLLFLSRVS